MLEKLPSRTVKDFMEKLESKRVGVSLSSGFFGFYAHAGFLAALEERGIRPAAIAGTSAGALTGALRASGLEPSELLDVLCAVKLADFVDPPLPWHLVDRPFGLLRGARLQRSLKRVMGRETFEALDIPYALTVFDLEQRAPRVVDSGPLIPALRASLSLPGMFQPAPLDGRLCWDGGVAEKTPLAFLSGRDDLDAVIICYVDPPGEQSAPRSLMTGLRTAQMTLIRPSDQRNVDALRARGVDVMVVAPTVLRCGPHRLRMGASIADLARRDTLRILEEGDLGHPDLS